MDGSSFDRSTRRLSVTTSRRAGIASLLAGALGIAGVSAADAARGAGRRHEKLACRNDQSECTANEQCCSGICKPKPGSGTDFRCVGKHKKKDKKKNEKDGAVCVEFGEPCIDSPDGCCPDFNGQNYQTCHINPVDETSHCGFCAEWGEICDPEAPVCCGSVQYNQCNYYQNVEEYLCCSGQGGGCYDDSSCCAGLACSANTCVPI